MVTNNSWNSQDPAQVAKGGTGAATLTGVLTGNGTSAITANAVTQYTVLLGGASNAVSEVSGVGTSGQVLTSNGAAMDPTWQDAAGGGVSGPGSSTDNALARWNGTGGDTLQDSTVIVTDAGEMTNGSQPCFLAQSTAQNDVTGDGTAYTMTFANETIDQNADYSSPTFTAPVTGIYNLGVYQLSDQYTSSHTQGLGTISTSNRNYRTWQANAANVRDSTNTISLQSSFLADMDAADTATSTITISNGTKVVDIRDGFAKFDGVLIC